MTFVNINNKRKFNIENVKCGGCVKKITNAIKAKDIDSHIDIDIESQIMELKSNLSDDDILEILRNLDYFPKNTFLNINNKRKFNIENVKCGGCVKKITNAIKAKDIDSHIDIDIESQIMELKSNLSDDDILEILRYLDYLPKTRINKDNNDKSSEIEYKNIPHVKKEINSPSEYMLLIEGMTCAACVRSVEKAMGSVSGVVSAKVNFANHTAQVSASSDINVLIKEVSNAGYKASLIQDIDKLENNRAERDNKSYRYKMLQSIAGIFSGLTLMLYGFLGDMTVSSGYSQVQWGIIGIICLFIMWFCGRHFYRGAWSMLKRFNSNMDTLVSLGTLSAWFYSMLVVLAPLWFDISSRHVYFEAAVMILGMINLGQALELKTRSKTSESISKLMGLQVKTAIVIKDGKDIVLPIEEVKKNDMVRVRNAEKVPVDGVILEGQSYINESMLTGEPVPIKKGVGDSVCAGTLNTDNSFVLQATQVGNTTKLAHIINMVRQAQNSKPPINNLADKVVGIFVPTVLAISIITALIWWFAGADTSHILVTSISVLIIACPCALGLATPISTIIGVGKAAEHGGLIRNGKSLQKASKINAVVLDKTGTITEGKPTVIDSLILDKVNKNDVFSHVMAMEQGSTHPIAKSLLDFVVLEKSNLEKTKGLESVTNIDGKGVSAKFIDKNIYLGNESLMSSIGVDLESSDFLNTIESWRNNAYTIVFFSIEKELKAIFAISDSIRKDSKQAITKLLEKNIKVIMLTGDNKETAKAVANQVGILDWHSHCLPEDKLNKVKQLQKEGYCVAVVGDGVNDTPALAIADVGFAIGEGTDTAIESSDITLLNPSLMGIANIIGISDATLRNIKQNLWGAFIYNVTGIPIAAGALYLATGWLLSPIIAGLAMSLSSVTVVSNANRLRMWSLDK